MKERAKTSPIWKPSAAEFAEIVSKSKTISEIFTFVGLTNKGANYKTLSKRISRDKLDTSHLKKSIPPAIKGVRSMQDILTENSSYNRTNLKRRLLAENLIEYTCSDCGMEPCWNGKKLCLQLDHKNGISNDNRLENLQFLCPNCHSQTESFAGRNKRYPLLFASRGEKSPRQNNLCTGCKKKISKDASRCNVCASSLRRGMNTKISWPTHHDLSKMVEEYGFLKTGRMLGVSDNPTRKHLKKQ